jgi:hypothetical protein
MMSHTHPSLCVRSPPHFPYIPFFFRPRGLFLPENTNTTTITHTNHTPTKEKQARGPCFFPSDAPDRAREALAAMSSTFPTGGPENSTSSSSTSTSPPSKKPCTSPTTITITTTTATAPPIADPPLLRLPDELYQLLLAFLPQPDVPSLRLACKHVEAAVVAHVRELELWGGGGNARSRVALLRILKRTQHLQHFRVPYDSRGDLYPLLLRALGDGSVGGQLRSMDVTLFRFDFTGLSDFIALLHAGRLPCLEKLELSFGYSAATGSPPRPSSSCTPFTTRHANRPRPLGRGATATRSRPTTSAWAGSSPGGCAC